MPLFVTVEFVIALDVSTTTSLLALTSTTYVLVHGNNSGNILARTGITSGAETTRLSLDELSDTSLQVSNLVKTNNGNLYLFSALTSILVGGIFAFSVKGNLELVPTERDLVDKGRLACGVASVAWIVDMACCWEFVSYLYLHSLWHCLMAVTANCLIEIHESQTKRTDRKGSIYHTSYGPFVFVFPSIVHQV